MDEAFTRVAESIELTICTSSQARTPRSSHIRFQDSRFEASLANPSTTLGAVPVSQIVLCMCSPAVLPARQSRTRARRQCPRPGCLAGVARRTGLAGTKTARTEGCLRHGCGCACAGACLHLDCRLEFRHDVGHLGLVVARRRLAPSQQQRPQQSHAGRNKPRPGCGRKRGLRGARAPSAEGGTGRGAVLGVAAVVGRGRRGPSGVRLPHTARWHVLI